MFITKSDSAFMQAIAPISEPIRSCLQRLPYEKSREVFEIRIRVNRPVMLITAADPLFITESGDTVYIPRGKLLCCDKQQLSDTLRQACGCSVHTYQQDIDRGFITLKGGHRMGVCGTAAIKDGGFSVHDISSVNIRVARQYSGISKKITEEIFAGGLCGLLLAGEPCSGKTTLLRDMAAQLSKAVLGKYYRVCIVDERGELAAEFNGIPQNDIGYCDVLSRYSKAEGILQAVRGLNPDVIFCDEIGGAREAQAVLSALNMGVPVVAGVHASNIDELYHRPAIRRLIGSGAFGVVAMLKGRNAPAEIEYIYEVRYDDGKTVGSGGSNVRGGGSGLVLFGKSAAENYDIG